jgi:hypothetical protein
MTPCVSRSAEVEGRVFRKVGRAADEKPCTVQTTDTISFSATVPNSLSRFNSLLNMASSASDCNWGQILFSSLCLMKAVG